MTMNKYTHRHGEFTFLDGYEWVAYMDRKHGWTSIGMWGADGWDMGDWPIVVMCRTTDPLRTWDDAGWPPGWMIAVRIEGDVEVERFDTEADQIARLDELAEWYWRRSFVAHYGDDNELGRALKQYPEGQLPERFRGPFRWERAKG